MENETKTISRQCLECRKLIKKQCSGKPAIDKIPDYFGTPVNGKPSGLNFCCQYELDIRLCIPRKETKADSIKDIRKRQVKKEVETENKEHCDDVDFAETLSSKDFEDLL